MWTTDDTSKMYEAIFNRKSVRKYKAEPLKNEFLEEILQKTVEAAKIEAELRAEFRLLNPEQIKGINSAKAPHFLAVYAEKDADSLVNAAFILQQTALWLSSRGIGSCWLGMPRPETGASALGGLPFAIMLAFGEADEDLQRGSVSEFKRKTIEEISDIGDKRLLEPVRLAPSGANRQPWFFSGNEKAVKLYCKQNGMIMKKMFGELSYFDMGIALCHLWLSAADAGKSLSFEKEREVSVPRGYVYVKTANID